jgi:hypothetical protein
VVRLHLKICQFTNLAHSLPKWVGRLAIFLKSYFHVNCQCVWYGLLDFFVCE